MSKIRKIGIPPGGATNEVLKKSSSADFDVIWGTGGGGGSGTINSGAQYRLPYYSTNPTGTILDPISAITASRALKSDANGLPTHFDTTTEPSLTELSYVKGVTSAIQTQLNGKQSTLTNPITGTGTANEIAYFTGSTTLASLTTGTYPSLTELSYVKGVTSSIQTQLNGKLGTGLAWLLASGGTLTGNNTITGTGYTLSAVWTSLGTTQTDGYGLWLRNTTAAAAGSQQISPSLVLEGQGWKTNATAASKSIKFALYTTPVQNTEANGYLSVNASIDGGAYVNIINYGYLSDPTTGVYRRCVGHGGIPVWPHKYNLYGVNMLVGADEGTSAGGNSFESDTRSTNTAKIFKLNGVNYSNTGTTAFIGILGMYSSGASTHRVYLGADSGISQNTTTEVRIGVASNDAVIKVIGAGCGIGMGTTALTASTRLQVRGTGTTTANLALFEDSAGTARLTLLDNGNLTTTGDITIADAKNIILNTTTGTKIGTSTTQKLGFFNATPVVQPSAYTQTYSTATKTHANLTSSDLSGITSSTTGSALAEPSAAYTQSEMQQNFRRIQDQYNALKADLTNLKQVVNQIIDDHQSLGLLG